MRPVRGTLGAAAAILVATATLGACGETSFDAEEFVERANRAGAGLELREELLSTSDDVKVWAVSFTGGASDLAATGTPQELERAADTDFAHGAGSLAVAADADAGYDEFERCEASATLVCFRAANVVLRLEGATAPETERLGEVFRSLESG